MLRDVDRLDVIHHGTATISWTTRTSDGRPFPRREPGRRLGKDRGIRLAWGEASRPTSARSDGSALARIPGHPECWRHGLSDTIDSSITTTSSRARRPPKTGGRQLAVQRTLYDLYDAVSGGNDEVAWAILACTPWRARQARPRKRLGTSSSWAHPPRNRWPTAALHGSQGLAGNRAADRRHLPAGSAPAFNWRERGAGPLSA